MSRNPFLDPPAGGTTMVKTEQDVAAVKLADDIFVSDTICARHRVSRLQRQAQSYVRASH